MAGRIVRRDRLGGLDHQHAQVTYGDTVFGKQGPGQSGAAPLARLGPLSPNAYGGD
jgi:hypothetical protein